MKLMKFTTTTKFTNRQWAVSNHFLVTQYENSNCNPSGTGIVVGWWNASTSFRLTPVETEVVKFFDQVCFQLRAKFAARSTLALTIFLSSNLAIPPNVTGYFLVSSFS